jgi:GT2 family glycosyltransferase
MAGGNLLTNSFAPCHIVMPDLSVIIVSYRGAERLSHCLSSLTGLGDSRLTAEVVIVNNSPGDEGIEGLKTKYPQFIFKDSAVNGGFAHGCNLGAEISSGKNLLFLNPDTIANADAVEKLVRRAGTEASVMISSCRQIRQDGSVSIAWGDFPGMWNLTGFQRAAGRLLQFRKQKMTENHGIKFYPDWVSGSVILISRDSFELLGGFDDRFWMYYEDVDICRRVADRGGKVVFHNDITIEHNHGGSTRTDLKTASLTKTEVMISRHLYISKHKKGSERGLIQAFLVINNLLTGIIPALTGVILFFIPRIFVRTLIYGRLLQFYAGACIRRSWVSPRAADSRRGSE